MMRMMSGDRDSDEQVQAEATEAAEEAEPSGQSGQNIPADAGSPAVVSSSGGRGAGRLPVTLALLLSLAALGVSGWLLYGSPDRAGELPGMVQDLDQRMAGLERRARDLESRLEQQLEPLDDLDGQLRGLVQDVDPLPGQIGELTARIDTVQGQLSQRQVEFEQLSEELGLMRVEMRAAVEQLSDRDQLERRAERDLQRQMAMTEAAALLRLGQDRVALVADFAGGAAAFQRAEARLAGIDDPRLERVRRALAVELDALESARSPDLARSLARLDRLARDIPNWPLQLPGQRHDTQSAPADGWRGRLAQTMGELVKVQQRDALGRTEAQFDAAREQLQLRLVAAQLALGRRDAAALRLHLQAAMDLIDEWFDVSSEAVLGGRSDIESLAGMDLSPAEPDLGQALELLLARLGGS